MHGQYISDNPRKALERSLAWLVAPEQHERKVLRSGMVCATVVSPFGVSLPYHFSAPELMEFEGQRIRLYFDPWEAPIKATITLAQDFMGLKAGHVITHFANCLNSVPEICEAANAAKSTDRELIAEMSICGIENTLRIKRYMQTDLRTETVLLGLRGGKKKTTEIRGSDNSLLRVESGIGVGDGATVVSSGAVSEISQSISNAENRRREREETDWDALEKFEAANRREFVGV
jgi:hypothetical protein